MIAYLQRAGYPEVALHFVDDEPTRFNLSLECGNLDVALQVRRGCPSRACVCERAVACVSARLRV